MAKKKKRRVIRTCGDMLWGDYGLDGFHCQLDKDHSCHHQWMGTAEGDRLVVVIWEDKNSAKDVVDDGCCCC